MLARKPVKVKLYKGPLRPAELVFLGIAVRGAWLVTQRKGAGQPASMDLAFDMVDRGLLIQNGDVVTSPRSDARTWSFVATAEGRRRHRAESNTMNTKLSS